MNDLDCLDNRMPEGQLMYKESERRKTFMGWPISEIRPEELARAGFVYLQTRDRVQCVFCLVKISDWEPHDNPFQEHMKHSPCCPFIQGLKCNNISLEDEVRGFSAQPLKSLQRRTIGNLEGFEPEKPNAQWFAKVNNLNVAPIK